jgi:hypothetical protein
MSPINSNKRLHLHIGIVFFVLIVGCKATRVLLPELHEDDTNWLKTESVHYFIYYRPGSPASENMKKISKNLDSCFSDVLNQLKVNFTAKIHYYLYNSKEDIERSTRRHYYGFAPEEFQCAAQVYASKYAKLDAHETVHIIVYNTIGHWKLRFLVEGTAEAIAHAHDEASPGRLSLHSKAKLLLHLEELFPLEIIARNARFLAIDDARRNDLYAECGSFVRYLIDKFDLDSFKTFYPRAGEDNYKEVFQETYAESIEDFEEEWHEFLRNY